MDHVISADRIQTTETYQNLINKNETIIASFLLKRNVRELISNGINVYNYTGTIPGHVTGNNLRVVKDLINQQNLNK